MLLAFGMFAAASATAPAEVIAFRPLGTVTRVSRGAEAAAWQTPDARIELLRDVDPQAVSVPLPDGCGLAAVGRDSVQVNCPHSDRYPQRSPDLSTPQVFALGDPGFAEVPGVGQGDIYNSVGAQWLGGVDCGDQDAHSGCPPVYLNWRDGRRVSGLFGERRDLDSPDLAAAPTAAPASYRVITRVSDPAHRRGLFVKPRGKPRFRVARCTQGCKPLLITGETLIWREQTRLHAVRLDDRRMISVRVPAGTTVPVELFATRLRVFLVSANGGPDTHNLLVARLPSPPPGACRLRRAYTLPFVYTFTSNDEARLTVAPRPTPGRRSAEGLYGCANDTGKQRLLGTLGPDASQFIYAGTPRFFKLAGRYAGYLIEHTSPDTPRDAVRRETLHVKDLRTGRQLLDSAPLAEIDPRFVLHPSGAVAWTETNLTANTVQIRAHDGSGLRLLDSGDGGELSPVRANGPDTICWTHTGEQRCAFLG